MAINLNVKLTGEVETFFKEMRRLGWSEEEIISKAMALLKIGYDTQRLALLKSATAEEIKSADNVLAVYMIK